MAQRTQTYAIRLAVEGGGQVKAELVSVVVVCLMAWGGAFGQGSKSVATTPASSSAPALKALRGSVGRQRQLNCGISGISAAQKLWDMSKADVLELSEEGFWRRAALQPATLAAVWAGHALAGPGKLMSISEGETAIVPRPELPWLSKPEEQTGMMPVAEVTMSERHVTEAEHEVAVAELEY